MSEPLRRFEVCLNGAVRYLHADRFVMDDTHLTFYALDLDTGKDRVYAQFDMVCVLGVIDMAAVLTGKPREPKASDCKPRAPRKPAVKPAPTEPPAEET